MRPTDAPPPRWVDLPVMDGFYVYAVYGSDNPDVPLYVGQSVNPMARLGSHLSRWRPDVTRMAIRQCASKDDMDATEVRLIVAYCPPWNTSGIPSNVRRRRMVSRRASEAARAKAQESAWQAFLASAWLTPRGVADRLNCSAWHVNRLVDEGVLRGTETATWQARRFRPEWVVDLLEARPELLASAYPSGVTQESLDAWLEAAS